MASGPSRCLALVAVLAGLVLSACSRPSDHNALLLGADAANFVDPTGSLSFEEVIRRRDELFRPAGPFGRVPAPSALWLTFPAPDPDALLAAGWNRPFALTLRQTGIRHVDAYLLSDGKLLERSWDWQDGRRRAGNGYRYPLMTLEPAQVKEATLYLRITADAPVRRTVWLSDFQSFFGNYNTETTALSITVGILIAILVYILALGSILKSRTNLWLAACISAELVHIVCLSAVFETQIVPGAVQVSLALILASSLAVQATLIAFAKNFIHVRQKSPRLKVVARLAAGMLGGMAVLALFDRDLFVPIVPALRWGTVSFLLLLCLAAVRHSPRRAGAFAVCWLPALAPIAVQTFARENMGFFANVAFTRGALFGLCMSFVLFAVLSSVDIRQRERALRRQILDNVHRFRGFAEIGTDGFWEIDAAGRITFLSGRQIGPARLALGEVLVDRLAASSSADYVRPIRETIAGRLPLDGRRVRLEEDGRDIWISLGGRAIEDGGGSGGAVYRGVLRDVTEETEREGRRVIEQQMLALGQLVGSVAHEVNNLIHPIVNLTRRLRNRQAGLADPESARLMDLIDLSSRQAAKVVSELLQSTREHRWKDIDRPLSLAVEYSVEAVRPALPASVKVDVVTQDIAQPTVKIGDIIQIVGNLLSNAVHAMDGRGQVSVSLTALPEGARLTVSDDGAGMDEGVRQRAMQPFFTTKTDGRGTGVGLYVVQKIVRDYGGWITIDSAPGLGTTFTILFPFRKGDDGDPEGADGPRRR